MNSFARRLSSLLAVQRVAATGGEVEKGMDMFLEARLLVRDHERCLTLTKRSFLVDDLWNERGQSGVCHRRCQDIPLPASYKKCRRRAFGEGVASGRVPSPRFWPIPIRFVFV